jgi:hypothetical protein
MPASHRTLVPAVALTLLALAVPSASAAAISKPRAVTLVTRILVAHRTACAMRWSAVTAVRSGGAWRVTARVTTSGNPGTASWWVQRAGGRVTPADPLSAEIEADCP